MRHELQHIPYYRLRSYYLYIIINSSQRAFRGGGQQKYDVSRFLLDSKTTIINGM